MNINQNQALMVLISVVLVASGCANGGNSDGSDTASTTDPIQINEFSAFPDPAPAGNQVTFTLELENTGSIDAQNVVAKLWNPPFASDSSDTRTWRDSSGGGVSTQDRSISYGTLRGNRDGVESFANPQTLKLTAPSLSEDQEFPYNFHSQVFYQYRTEGTSTVTVMSNDEYRSSGAEKSQTVGISQNNAPIQLETQVLAGNPLVFYDSDGGSKEAQFCVVVNNEGSGQAFLQSAYQGEGTERYVVNDQNENRVRLTVQDIGSANFELPNGGQTTTVELIGGDQVRQCYDMTITGLGSATEIQEEIGPISVTAEYGYVKDTSNTVRVEGRAGSATTNSQNTDSTNDNQEPSGQSTDDSSTDDPDASTDGSESPFEPPEE